MEPRLALEIAKAQEAFAPVEQMEGALDAGVQVAIEGRPPIIHYGYLRSVDKWVTQPVAEFDAGP